VLVLLDFIALPMFDGRTIDSFNDDEFLFEPYPSIHQYIFSDQQAGQQQQQLLLHSFLISTISPLIPTISPLS
jgi:hypothetical protein